MASLAQSIKMKNAGTKPAELRGLTKDPTVNSF